MLKGSMAKYTDPYVEYIKACNVSTILMTAENGQTFQVFKIEK